MKSIIPLIIALVLVLMLVLATIYFTTMIVTYNANISSGPKSTSEWWIFEEEIKSVLLTSLMEGSQKAAEAFNQTFKTLYTDQGFSEDPNRVIVRESRYGWDTNSYIYYKYSRYSSTTIYCQTNDPDDLYKKNLEGYNMSRTQFIDAIHKASTTASAVLSDTVWATLQRWVEERSTLGYRIQIIDVLAYYYVDLQSNPTNGSIGINRVGVHAVIDVYSPWSGYKRFSERVEAEIRTVFKEGVEGDTEIYIPIKTTAYLTIGNNRIAYMLDPSNITIILYSKMFHRMSETVYTPGQLDMVKLKDVAGYYHGNGETTLYYAAEMKRNVIALILNSMIYNMSLSDPDADDSYRVPCSEDDPNTYIVRHTMTFFIGGLLYATIDGIYMTTPIQIVYTYMFDTAPTNYDWVFDDHIVGDPGQVTFTSQ